MLLLAAPGVVPVLVPLPAQVAEAEDVVVDAVALDELCGGRVRRVHGTTFLAASPEGKKRETTTYPSILPHRVAADVVRRRGDGAKAPADHGRLDLLDGLRQDVGELIGGRHRGVWEEAERK